MGVTGLACSIPISTYPTPCCMKQDAPSCDLFRTNYIDCRTNVFRLLYLHTIISYHRQRPLRTVSPLEINIRNRVRDEPLTNAPLQCKHRPALCRRDVESYHSSSDRIPRIRRWGKLGPVTGHPDTGSGPGLSRIMVKNQQGSA